ncbi:hypothetical protein MUK42_08636 [Musa troglodytarum]|uniref:Uncharacterized protein n=1 Tax=Musa troglodytarum TaxID=320322 RepID=A0A9E7JGJ2_9LILI|nr:hypothetical protein MUK42_08636 [Musa troglodytarum]
MNLIIKLIRSGSVRATRFRPDPGRTGPPGSDGPSRARPSRSGPSRAERSRAGPSRAEPNGAEPGRTSRSCRAGPFINCNGPGRNEAEAGRAGPSRRPGLAAGSSRSEAGQDRTGSCPTRLGPAQLGPARLGSARLQPARLGLVRLVSARLGSCRSGVSRANNASDTVDSATRVRGIVGMRNAPATARARVHPPSLFAHLHFERSICSPTSPSKTTSSWCYSSTPGLIFTFSCFTLLWIPFEFLGAFHRLCFFFVFLRKWLFRVKFDGFF